MVKLLLRKQYLHIQSTVILFSDIVVVYRYLYGVKVRESILGTFPMSLGQRNNTTTCG